MFEYFLKEPFDFHIMTHVIAQKILMTTRHMPDVKNQGIKEIRLFLFVNFIIYYLFIMLLISRKEKEKLVIKLAKEDKTTREIAKLVHISLKDLGDMIENLLPMTTKKIQRVTKMRKKKKRGLARYLHMLKHFIFLEKRNH